MAAGDHLLVSPAGIEVRVRSIHAQNRAAEQAGAGQRCALNLSGAHFEKTDLLQICLLTSLGSVGIQDSHLGLIVIQALDGPIRFD